MGSEIIHEDGRLARQLRWYHSLVPPLLDVRHLTVEFAGQSSANRAAAAPSGSLVPTQSLAAVRDVSFTIAPREVLGLVGESGSGKSLTSLALMRLLPAQARARGEILIQNGTGSTRDLLQLPELEMRGLRGAKMAMIFQEPMTALNPVMRVGDQIAEAAAVHGRMTRKDAWERAVEALQDVAIPDAARRARDYPHQLSGGMRQRVM
ncbi:MAG TPA: ATP-binding cassette domain-containing protein, partial [Terriglobales bacterium]|nr:ATP-binding cassette domain-containing protein [Terriglobales bacterium]